MAGTPVRFEPGYGPGRRNAGSAGGIARPPGATSDPGGCGLAAGGILPGVGPVSGTGAGTPIAHTRFGEREAPQATRGASLLLSHLGYWTRSARMLPKMRKSP